MTKCQKQVFTAALQEELLQEQLSWDMQCVRVEPCVITQRSKTNEKSIEHQTMAADCLC